MQGSGRKNQLGLEKCASRLGATINLCSVAGHCLPMLNMLIVVFVSFIKN